MFKKSVIVVQEASPNEASFLKIYHTRFEISKSPIEIFHRPLRPSSETYLNEVGEPGKTLVRKIMCIPGVVKVATQPYRISVEISLAYSFEEIEPKVLEILKSAVPNELLKEERPFVFYIPWQQKGNSPLKTDTKKTSFKESFEKVTAWFKKSFEKVSTWFKKNFK
ncbi:MAG: hypothetical protein XD93_0239 [candidate division WS6 bacterium 34_10]|uniref:Uncharacterized protein n=1 Tax=candidate division WS6 bacterium 34_10 TaxID=1641389 RepID=A0A101HIQ3_9BACT|nr:MAG: hypothetical protein XD93_0239 [candidate division WS6 bacterium 34_10]